MATAPSEKTIAIRKLTDSLHLPDWGGQPYIVEQSSKQQLGIAHYNLGKRS
jgi:hypothetical protein